MTDKKPATFAKGDNVTNKQGHKLVVINQGHPGGAVHVETPAGEKPYFNGHFSADSLTASK